MKTGGKNAVRDQSLSSAFVQSFSVDVLPATIENISLVHMEKALEGPT
jgi:hypothetical protein